MKWTFILLCLLLSSTVLALEISFFEEFPTSENLAKVEMVHFETKVYVAAESLEDFYRSERKLKNFSTVTEVVYWPILPEEAGYWFSPWMDRVVLEDFVNDTLYRSDDLPLLVMLDFEPPKNRWDILKRDGESKENKKTIERFLLEAPHHNIGVYTIEMTHAPVWLLESFGFSYDSARYSVKKIRMYYSSFRRPLFGDTISQWLFRREAARCARFGEVLGIGLIARGIYGDEPVYDYHVLKRELEIAQEEGVEEVVIFRLGGVDGEVRTGLEDFYNKYLIK